MEQPNELDTVARLRATIATRERELNEALVRIIGVRSELYDARVQITMLKDAARKARDERATAALSDLGSARSKVDTLRAETLDKCLALFRSVTGTTWNKPWLRRLLLLPVAIVIAVVFTLMFVQATLGVTWRTITLYLDCVVAGWRGTVPTRQPIAPSTPDTQSSTQAQGGNV